MSAVSRQKGEKSRAARDRFAPPPSFSSLAGRSTQAPCPAARTRFGDGLSSHFIRGVISAKRRPEAAFPRFQNPFWGGIVADFSVDA
jgi:hypothetical protein